jgi:hypothetical protein
MSGTNRDTATAHVNVGALFTKHVAVMVLLLNAVAPPTPVTDRLAMFVGKLPAPSQACAVRETVPLKFLLGTKRIMSVACSTSAAALENPG